MWWPWKRKPSKSEKKEEAKAVPSETLEFAVVSVAGGHQFAAGVVRDVVKRASAIDPSLGTSTEAALAVLNTLQELKITGFDLWIFYSDRSGSSLVNMIGVVRGYQLGILKEEDIRALLSGEGSRLSLREIRAKVREESPSFQRSRNVRRRKADIVRPDWGPQYRRDKKGDR